MVLELAPIGYIRTEFFQKNSLKKKMVFKNGVINIRAAIHELLPNWSKSDSDS